MLFCITHKDQETPDEKEIEVSMPVWPLLIPIACAMIVTLAIRLCRPSPKPLQRFPKNEFAGPHWRLTDDCLLLFERCFPPEQEEVLRDFLAQLEKLLATPTRGGLVLTVDAIEVSASLAQTMYNKGILHRRDLFRARGGIGGTIDVDHFEIVKGTYVHLIVLKELSGVFRFIVTDEEGTSHAVQGIVEFLLSYGAALSPPTLK